MHNESLKSLGLNNPGNIFFNLSAEDLRERALANGEGILTNTGALSCCTGEFTGRSPNDKFIVKDSLTENKVDWGKVNQPISAEHFDLLRQDQLKYLEQKTLYVQDAFGGKDKSVRVPIRVINESAWANLFAKHLFVRPTPTELQTHEPEYHLVHTPNFSADPAKHGTRSKTFIAVNFTEKLILIGGTSYAGEIKKSIFSLLNFIFPLQGILSMHCSANVATDHSNAALFFGLSGTGKTTLSADPHRLLIGDDEHGWSDSGIFNFEGGCYAKCINLSRENEPEIWDAIRDGAILENVVVDKDTGVPDFSNTSLTENTRAAYPVEYINGAVLEGIAGHPENIIFLTCDAFGVMPPVSRLSTEQAMIHFLSGYTAKVAGTEKGVGNTPQATFSACFGSPFLPLKPTDYAKLLERRMKKHQADCWLVNTGWSGGAYGVGSRIKLKYTRAIIDSILSGRLKSATFKAGPALGLQIPESVLDVPSGILNPKATWQEPDQYDKQAAKLATLFKDNLKKFDLSALNISHSDPEKIFRN
jgi:phosphoenolpyruvate carboxykinase (ATP)